MQLHVGHRSAAHARRPPLTTARTTATAATARAWQLMDDQKLKERVGRALPVETSHTLPAQPSRYVGDAGRIGLQVASGEVGKNGLGHKLTYWSYDVRSQHMFQLPNIPFYRLGWTRDPSRSSVVHNHDCLSATIPMSVPGCAVSMRKRTSRC